MKDKKGVTLIALVFTIIIILILASIAVYSGASTIRYVKYNKAKSEIQVIQSYVNEWYKEYKNAENQELFLNQYGEPTSVCNSTELENTFVGGGITDENKKGNYKFFSESFLKDKIGIDVSFDYLISIQDRDTILYNGVVYNQYTYFTIDDFGVQNIKELLQSETVSFDLAQGDNSDIIISNLKIKYLDYKNEELIEKYADISKFIVEYKKTIENNWIDVTKDIIKFNNNGETKFKFSVPDGTYNVRIWTTDKKKQGTNEQPIVISTSKLTDGEKDKLASNGIAELTGDEITNDNLKDTTKIKAVITGQVPIPVEATYEEGTVDTGVVVSIDGSEFVWVPVPNVIASSAPSSTGVDLASNPNTKRPMAILQSGSDTNYQGVLYNFSGTTSTAKSILSVTGKSGYREPAYLTNSSVGDATSYNTVGITQSSLQGEYNSMIASITKYGGFYVGRYELGLEGTNPVSKPASASVTTANAANSNTNSWYGLYSKCKSYNVDNLTSTMIWGSQYDAMMNWMAKTGKTIGTADSSKYNTEQTTGSKSEDVINNIFDLYGCHCEWTLEAADTSGRAVRGGNYDGSVSPSYHYSFTPSTATAIYGSRLSLYIK